MRRNDILTRGLETGLQIAHKWSCNRNRAVVLQRSAMGLRERHHLLWYISEISIQILELYEQGPLDGNDFSRPSLLWLHLSSNYAQVAKFLGGWDVGYLSEWWWAHWASDQRWHCGQRLVLKIASLDGRHELLEGTWRKRSLRFLGVQNGSRHLWVVGGAHGRLGSSGFDQASEWLERPRYELLGRFGQNKRTNCDVVGLRDWHGLFGGIFLADSAILDPVVDLLDLIVFKGVLHNYALDLCDLLLSVHFMKIYRLVNGFLKNNKINRDLHIDMYCKMFNRA